MQRGVADSSSILDAAANGPIHASASAAVDDVHPTSSQAPVQPVLPSKVSALKIKSSRSIVEIFDLNLSAIPPYSVFDKINMEILVYPNG